MRLAERTRRRTGEYYRHIPRRTTGIGSGVVARGRAGKPPRSTATAIVAVGHGIDRLVLHMQCQRVDAVVGLFGRAVAIGVEHAGVGQFQLDDDEVVEVGVIGGKLPHPPAHINAEIRRHRALVAHFIAAFIGPVGSRARKVAPPIASTGQVVGIKAVQVLLGPRRVAISGDIDLVGAVFHHLHILAPRQV